MDQLKKTTYHYFRLEIKSCLNKIVKTKKKRIEKRQKTVCSAIYCCSS